MLLKVNQMLFMLSCQVKHNPIVKFHEVKSYTHSAVAFTSSCSSTGEVDRYKAHINPCIYGASTALSSLKCSVPDEGDGLNDVRASASTMGSISSAFEGRSKKTVAIIGAGPSGLVAAKSALEAGLIPTVFDRAARVGGMWNAEAVPLWSSLRANLSRFTCAFSDHNWPESAPMFPSQQEMQAYLESYTARFLSSTAQLCMSTEVTSIEPSPTGTWQVMWTALANPPMESTATFDHVIVASGFFSAAHLPPLPGRESSPIKVIHSAEYHSAEDFKDMHVVVAGASFSAVDIAADVGTMASKVTHVIPRPFWCVPRHLPSDPSSIAPTFLPLDLVLYRRSTRTTDGEAAMHDPQRWRKTNQYLQSICGDQGALLSPALDCCQDSPPYVAISDTYAALTCAGRIQPLVGRVAGVHGRTVLLQTGNGVLNADESMESGGDKLESLGEPIGDIRNRAKSVGGRAENVDDGAENMGGRVTSVGDRVTSVGDRVKNGGDKAQSFDDRVKSVDDREKSVGDNGESASVNRKSVSGGVEDVGDRIQSPYDRLHKGVDSIESVGNTIENVGTLVLCTGYRTCLPFLSQDLLHRLSWDPDDMFMPLLLHKGVFHPRVPGLAFVGFYRGPYFGVMELQARWATAVFAGLLPQPSEEELLEGIAVEARVKASKPRLQFPHGDYVGLADDLARQVDRLLVSCQQSENRIPSGDTSYAVATQMQGGDISNKLDEQSPACRQQCKNAVSIHSRSSAAAEETIVDNLSGKVDALSLAYSRQRENVVSIHSSSLATAKETRVDNLAGKGDALLTAGCQQCDSVVSPQERSLADAKEALGGDLVSKSDESLPAWHQQDDHEFPVQIRSLAAAKELTADGLASKADKSSPAWRRQYDIVVSAQYRSRARAEETMAAVQRACARYERGAMVAAAVFKALQGEWQLSREISSSFPGSPSGKVRGTASFTVTSSCNEYLYHEQGEFVTNGGAKMRVSREYVYAYRPEKDCIEAFFAEKLARANFFHTLHFLPLETASQTQPQPFTIPIRVGACGGAGTCTALDEKEGIIEVGSRWPGLMSRPDAGWCAVGYHLCEKDHYNVSYKFQFAGLNLSEFQICYRVRGPQKDYISTAVYRRKQDP